MQDDGPAETPEVLEFVGASVFGFWVLWFRLNLGFKTCGLGVYSGFMAWGLGFGMACRFSCASGKVKAQDSLPGLGVM